MARSHLHDAAVPGGLSAVYALADRHVEASCALDPNTATAIGVAGYDDRLTDYSTGGVEERAALHRRTLAELETLEPADDDDRIAARLLAERLGADLALHDAGEHLRAIRNIASPIQRTRQVFDLMSTETADDWAIVARRLGAIPVALDQLRSALVEGMDRGVVAARRQAVVAAGQAATWAGEDGSTPFFERFVARADQHPDVRPALATELDVAATRAGMAYGDLARFLRDDYAPVADERDAVGPERYAAWARVSLGADIDLADTYAWAWDDLARIEDEMVGECRRIGVSDDIAATIEHLERDSPLVIEGEEALRTWLQDLMDRTIAELDGSHFDIPEPVRRVEAMIAPPGGAAAMYYTGPSEDFSRPGRTWYPTLGKTRFPLWGEVSIAYHEGVPGHHLQIGQVRFLRDRLSRFQRTTGVAAHMEGWALYAERLMDELGFLTEPAYRLGMLRAQAMRAVRVIVDIGMHLELSIPERQPFPADLVFHPGERWTPELGQAFVDQRSRFPVDFMASEIVRYLGWPAQAISYKVGERAWLEARDAARARHADGFDLKAFHRFALDLGPLGLDDLGSELGRF
jgi:uncharacterized protein (DUF885 family)